MDLARTGGRLQWSLARFLPQRGYALGLLRAAAGHERERDRQDEGGAKQSENDPKVLPERLGGHRPRLGLTARLQQPQRGVYAFRNSKLVEELGVLTAEAFEIGRAFDRQPAGEIA